MILASAMPEAEFWRIVDGLGWGTKTTDYKALNKYLRKTLSEEGVGSLRTTLSKVESRLYKAIEGWERESGKSCGLGDDGFSDLIAHIVGLGKKEYDAVLRDPQQAYDRAHAKYGTKGGFTESFNYAIPYESDY